MIDYRFTGHINNAGKRSNIDVRFRTDAINATDEKFNILQVQVGPNYDSTADPHDPTYQKFFAGYQDAQGMYPFLLQKSSKGAMIAFAMKYGIDLRQYVGNGKGVYLVVDSSHSISGLG